MINIPFNHQPDTTTVRTGSYTIPAGKYARVVVIEGTQNFTIDAAIAVNQWEFSGSGAINNSTVFTNTSPYTLVGTISVQSFTGAKASAFVGDGADSNIIKDWTNGDGSGDNSNAVQGISLNIRLNRNDFIRETLGNTAAGTVFWSLKSEDTPKHLEFWVPSGTALVGAKYTVELYNELS